MFDLRERFSTMKESNDSPLETTSITHPYDDESSLEDDSRINRASSTAMIKSSEKEYNRTAILLLDFQNEFAKKGGKLHDEAIKVVETIDILKTVPKLVDFARKTKAMVIHSPLVLEENRPMKFLESDNSTEVECWEQYGLFTENTWNCEIIHELEPKNNDYVLQDRIGFSAFEGTELQSILKANSVQYLFIIGCQTNASVYNTSTDASQLLPNISTYIVSNRCAAKTMEEHEVGLKMISKDTATVISFSKAEFLLEKYAGKFRRDTIDDNCDEWLLIDKIFSSVKVDKKEVMSIDKFRSSIGARTPSRSSILEILPNNRKDKNIDTSQHSLDRESMHKILFERKERSGFLAKIPLYIIMGLLPCFYSISTRLPFIFLALEITVEREGTLWQVGAILGLYQTFRAFGNLFIVSLGGNDPFRRLHFFMAFVGLCGWLFSAFYKRRSSDDGLFSLDINFDDDNDEVLSVQPLFALLGVGFSETIVNLQRSIMLETAKESPAGLIDKSILSNRLGLQYASVACGSVAAYIGGGLVYTHYGFRAVCEMGILCHIVQLISTLIYIYSSRSKKNHHIEELDGTNDLVRSVTYQFQTESVISKYAQNIAKGPEYALNAAGELSNLHSVTRQAHDDRILVYSLREMFRAYFIGDIDTRDDVTCMEDLLQSINNSTLESKRPLVKAVKKRNLARLIIFLMKTRGEQSSLTEDEFVAYWAPRVYRSMFQSSREANVSVVWPYMKSVVLTQAIMAFCIGTFLSTALLSYTTRFNLEADMVGLLLGIGEFLGMITILLKQTISAHLKKRKAIDVRSPSAIKAIFARPLHVPFVLIITSFATMSFAIPNFAVAIFCQMVMSSLNDTSVTLLNELIGTSLPADKFKYYQGLGQWLRRLGNMATGILGPVLFGLHQSFPFVFFGAIVLFWSIVLFYFMYRHAKKVEQTLKTMRKKDPYPKKEVKNCFSRSTSFLTPFVESSRTAWHILERRYYSLNKEKIEAELNPWEKAYVNIAVLEQRIRYVTAALEVEKDQRRSLEDRMYARM